MPTIGLMYILLLLYLQPARVSFVPIGRAPGNRVRHGEDISRLFDLCVSDPFVYTCSYIIVIIIISRPSVLEDGRANDFSNKMSKNNAQRWV